MMSGSWGAFSTREEEQKKRAVPDGVLLKRVYDYSRNYRRNLLFGALAIFLSSLTGLFSPYMHKLAIDQIIQTRNFSGFFWWIPLFVIIVLGNYVLQYIQTFQMRIVGENVVAKMRDEMMEKLQAISLRYFSEGEIGRIISRPINDANTVRIFLRMGVTSMLLDTSSILGSFLIMLVLDFKLTLVALCVLPFAIGLIWFLGRFSRAAARKALSTLGGVTARMQEDLAGIKVIQALVGEEKAKSAFEKTQDANIKANMRAIFVSSSYMPLVMSMRLIGTIVILWFGASLIKDGMITIGTLVAFTEYQFSYFMPLVDLVTMYDQYQSVMAAIERLFDLMDTKVEIIEAAIEKRIELR